MQDPDHGSTTARAGESPLSNPDKVLFPDDGITKAELRDYYVTVADVMVPHAKDRPMNLWRWNKGIAHEPLIQQSLPKGAPEWVKRCEVPRRKGGDITHGMINDADTLRWLAQQNCITPHVWNARCDLREKPDRLVFDLDPSEDDFDKIRAAALAVADMLRDIGLTPFAKVSGSRGIHVVAPLKRLREADEVRAAAGALAERIAGEHAGHAHDRVAQGQARRADSRGRRAQHVRADDRRRLRGARPPGRAGLGAGDVGRGRGPRRSRRRPSRCGTWGSGSPRSGTSGRTSTSTRARCRRT